MGKHISGGKIASSHSSYIDAVGPLLKKLSQHPAVSKISLGIIKPHLPPSSLRVKIMPLSGGLKVVVRGTNSLQEIFVYTTDTESVHASIADVYSLVQ
jgi:hypothetical protein